MFDCEVDGMGGGMKWQSFDGGLHHSLGQRPCEKCSPPSQDSVAGVDVPSVEDCVFHSARGLVKNTALHLRVNGSLDCRKHGDGFSCVVVVWDNVVA